MTLGDEATLFLQLYDYFHYGLAAIYTFFSIFYAIRFIVRKSGSKRKAISVIFNVLLVTGLLGRAAFFSLQPSIMNESFKISNSWNVFLNYAFTLFFFTDYWIMLFLWAEIYHEKGWHEQKSLSMRKMIPLFLFVNICAYVAIMVFEILDLINPDNKSSDVSAVQTFYQKMVGILYVVCYELTALAYFFYGAGFYMRLNFFGSSIAKRVLAFSILFGIIFTGRAAIILADELLELKISKYFYFDFLYYIFMELIPVSLMFELLKVPAYIRRTADIPARSSNSTYNRKRNLSVDDYDSSSTTSEKSSLLINK